MFCLIIIIIIIMISIVHIWMDVLWFHSNHHSISIHSFIFISKRKKEKKIKIFFWSLVLRHFCAKRPETETNKQRKM